ncbi:MAG: hypothetical protein V3S37_07690, partial [Dehalococcoidia bacterium]
MKKRFGLLSLFGVTALLVAMIGVISVLAAPSAADPVTGTIELDEDWYTITPSGEGTVDGSKVLVTVADADKNIAQAQCEATVSVGNKVAGNTVQITGLAKPIVGTPVALVTDGVCGGAVKANLEVQVTSAALGIINVVVGVNADYGFVDIDYETSEIDTVDVKIISTQDPDGIEVSATESGNDTGEFEVTITLTEDASSSTIKTLKSLDLDVITATYEDLSPAGGGTSIKVSASASVETGEPAFASLLPVDEHSTQGTQPAISGIINDVGGAGIDVSEVAIVFDAGPNAGSNLPTMTGAIDGDASVSFTFTPAVQPEDTYNWYVRATDMAGNTGRSDADPDTAGDQSHILKIDVTAPAVDSARTGKYWDTDTDA